MTLDLSATVERPEGGLEKMFDFLANCPPLFNNKCKLKVTQASKDGYGDSKECDFIYDVYFHLNGEDTDPDLRVIDHETYEETHEEIETDAYENVEALLKERNLNASREEELFFINLKPEKRQLGRNSFLINEVYMIAEILKLEKNYIDDCILGEGGVDEVFKDHVISADELVQMLSKGESENKRCKELVYGAISSHLISKK